MPVGVADLEYAAKKMAGGKDVVVSGVNVRVFDLLDEKERAELEHVEKELLNKMYLGVITLSANRTDIFHRPDGSTTWMRLLEWVEYRAED